MKAYILGEFPPASINQFIALEDVERAMMREPGRDTLRRFGRLSVVTQDIDNGQRHCNTNVQKCADVPEQSTARFDITRHLNDTPYLHSLIISPSRGRILRPQNLFRDELLIRRGLNSFVRPTI